MVMDSISATWGLEHESPLRCFVGFEAAIVGAWATWQGIKGFDVYTFAFLGFVVARTSQTWWVHMGLMSLDTQHGIKSLILSYYTIVVVIFLYLAEGRAHKLFVVLVTPVMGALLVVSAVAFGITEYCVTPVFGIHLFGFLEKVWPKVTPVTGAWVRFLLTITSQTAKDYGIFAGNTYGPSNPAFSLDRIVGWVFCFLLWGVGAGVQYMLKTKADKEKNVSPEVESFNDNAVL